MFDDLNLQLVEADLSAMSPKYSICAKCNASYKIGATCVQCAIMWATLSLTITETIRSYNCDWLQQEYKNEHLPS